ncbi:MAG TPA: DUF6503 family protein [Candidatus Polarisedimenticolia bacterium]|nr:DUF6503 family protein [Candidatus Polarisedimenticolia bacterium]
MMPYLALAVLSSLTAKELLDRSIAYHDPHGSWERGAFEVTELASQPDGTAHRNVFRFDNARNRFELESSVDGRVLNLVVENDDAVARVDGEAHLSADELERYRLKPAQVLSRRNRDLYLWGLPMKLRDPGTRLDPRVKETHFGGRAVYQLRVTYDAGVGSDTWYFFLDRETYALVGHRYHHDESAGDGEYAVLSGEIAGLDLRLPRVRQWYTNKDDKAVITHTILSIVAP